MAAHQPIYDIAEICAQHGIQNAVLCPGSRCAPLTLAFANHAAITCRTFSDERSAGFIGLGLAQQTHSPSVLVCTSGSAAYNFAPAVAEAFFQQIPLIVFTADRPAEWIDQWDGQTIRQQNIFGAHVKRSYNLPSDYLHPDSVWHINRVVNEAIALAQTFPAGPVHINVPLREPLYPQAGEKIKFSKKVKVVQAENTQAELTKESKTKLAEQLAGFTRILVIAGQQENQAALLKAVTQFCTVHQATLIGDVISNFHGAANTIRFADVFLAHAPDSIKSTLQPELIITFGKSVISKNLKQFLRKYAPAQHWHVQPSGQVPDPFQSLTKTIACEVKSFFSALSSAPAITKFDLQKKTNYTKLWQAEEHRVQRCHQSYFASNSFHELQAAKTLIDTLPSRCNFHVANSMSVRYANLIGLTEKQKGIHVYSNRGTSGIDGCTSTTIGHTLASDVPNILLTGDLAFFYDRNAFWHNYKEPNLRVVVINNKGGVIFNLIDGPGQVAEKDEFFVTNQQLSARHLANEFNHVYLSASNQKELTNALKEFYTFDGKTKILEITGDQVTATQAFNELKQAIKKSYAT
ncbi:MAG: 2-succinyl-5-enolpyruvyl-6-hydroxy-3-cyclohexene-1-carboxylic-acid synthase [Cyclobacteriaceae bacterium]|nr:MAG: 2-succinyl-5-enolpyruvyl-6-hydroxy-3-cyclohexene-1-carboxylic-acid synthase [Cyclobacteriaceae bacterium]